MDGDAVPSLQRLIETEIPEGRANLESSYANLERVAAYCEANYLQSVDKKAAFEETRRYTIQSLASVAYQINGLAYSMLHMLDAQADKVDEMVSQVENISQIVDIHKEKVARREIGQLTTNKAIPRQHKIIQPSEQEKPQRYARTPIDYGILDGIGHGVVTQPQSRHTTALHHSSLARTESNVSGSSGSSQQKYSNAGQASAQQQRIATLSRGQSQRTAYAPPQQQQQQQVRYANSNVGQMNTNYGHPSPYAAGMMMGNQMPPTPQQMHEQYRLTVDTMARNDDLPPPPSPMLDYGMQQSPPLPPPPPMLMGGHQQHQQGHHLMPDLPIYGTMMPKNHRSSTILPPWVPPNYIEKVIATYDYEAVKPDELSFVENQIIYVLRKNDDGWYEGVCDGLTGLFPGNYVENME